MERQFTGRASAALTRIVVPLEYLTARYWLSASASDQGSSDERPSVLVPGKTLRLGLGATCYLAGVGLFFIAWLLVLVAGGRFIAPLSGTGFWLFFALMVAALVGVGQATLHLLCGKMAAGKSTLARDLALRHKAFLLEETIFWPP